MTERKLFGVVVRAFGLWSIILGLGSIHRVVQIFGVQNIENYDWQPAVAFAVFYLAMAVVLLRKSELIVDFAYPVQSPKPTGNSN
jgi:ABC-type sulfate transport system permease component